jgi:hypothetical protein
MVNAQAVHHARVDQLKDQPVRIVEDRIIFNPNADQPGDLKEAPPRELLRRFPPGHQPPALRLVQLGNALILAVRARVERILGVVVDQRGLFVTGSRFRVMAPFSSSASKVSPRNGSVSGRDPSISK